jgi:hypothetical protein
LVTPKASLYTFLLSLCLQAPAIAHKLKPAPAARDTSFVKSYDREITGRFFFSQKYTGLRVPGTANMAAFRYRPNTTLNTGLGATYRSFTLNLAYGLPGINGDGSERGTTRYLDAQAHLYGSKVVIDLFAQLYNGYYLAPKNFVTGFEGFYLKPDLRIRLFGGSAHYVFNNSKFSYRASLIQNEWQTRSSGTFLLGGDIFYGTVNSDSVVVPGEIAHYFPQGNVRRIRFINIGPGGGYAYTFVYKRHWFATGSVTVNFPLDFVKETTYLEHKNHVSITPNFLYRLALGYNSRRWIYTASVVNSTVSLRGSYNSHAYRMNTGNYRLTLARRFSVNRKVRKVMQPVDDVLSLPQELRK